MGVTNGFLKLIPSEFQQIRNNVKVFEKRLFEERQLGWSDDSENYLDMDKAGYELLWVLGYSSSGDVPLTNPPYPHIAEVLGGGEVISPNADRLSSSRCIARTRFCHPGASTAPSAPATSL